MDKKNRKKQARRKARSELKEIGWNEVVTKMGFGGDVAVGGVFADISEEFGFDLPAMTEGGADGFEED